MAEVLLELLPLARAAAMTIRRARAECEMNARATSSY